MVEVFHVIRFRAFYVKMCITIPNMKPPTTTMPPQRRRNRERRRTTKRH